MTSFSGSIAYLRYVSLTNKGGVNVGDEFNSVFKQGKMDENRINFTAQLIADDITAEAGVSYYEHMPMWTPVLDVKKVRVIKADNTIKDYEVVEVKDAEYSTPEAGKVNYNVSGDKKTIGFKFASDIVIEATDKIKLGFRYNQEVLPANDIPTIGPKMERIALVAEPRHIAVKYDQITA